MTFEYALELPAGPSDFNTTLVPVKDDTGVLPRLIAVARDFTGRKRAEAREKEHERQIFQAAKLASLGTLVAGVRARDQQPEQFHPVELAELPRGSGGHPPPVPGRGRRLGERPHAGEFPTRRRAECWRISWAGSKRVEAHREARGEPARLRQG